MRIATETNPLFEDISELNYSKSEQNDAGDDIDPRAELGSTPSVDSVLDILSRAEKCSDNNLTEDGWNIYVHQTVLDLAIASFVKESDDLVRHILWFVWFPSPQL